MSAPRPGKVLEAEVRLFFRSSSAWSHGFDNVGASAAKCPRCSQSVGRLNARRPADRIACYRSLSVLVECKETGQPRLPWDHIQEHQVRHLDSHEAAGGVSLLVVRWNIPRAPRAWLLPWASWPALRERLASRQSLPLSEAARPDLLVELPRRRLRIEDPGPTWDLSVYLDPIAARRQP